MCLWAVERARGDHAKPPLSLPVSPRAGWWGLAHLLSWRTAPHINAMAKRIDPRYFNTLIDANVLDRLGDADDEAVDEMLSLHGNGKITLMLPHSVKHEIEDPNTPAEVKARAMRIIYTDPVTLTPNEVELHRRMRDLMQGNALPGTHDRDAYHVVEAGKYGGYFVTRDARLLKKGREVHALEVVSPTEFMRMYRKFATSGR